MLLVRPPGCLGDMQADSACSGMYQSSDRPPGTSGNLRLTPRLPRGPGQRSEDPGDQAWVRGDLGSSGLKGVLEVHPMELMAEMSVLVSTL